MRLKWEEIPVTSQERKDEVIEVLRARPMRGAECLIKIRDLKHSGVDLNGTSINASFSFYGAELHRRSGKMTVRQAKRILRRDFQGLVKVLRKELGAIQ